MLDQEPQLDDNKTVRQVVEDAETGDHAVGRTSRTEEHPGAVCMLVKD